MELIKLQVFGRNGHVFIRASEVDGIIDMYNSAIILIGGAEVRVKASSAELIELFKFKVK